MKISKTIVSIISLTILEGLALVMGVDGQMFATTISFIAGLGGYYLGKKRNELKNGGD